MIGGVVRMPCIAFFLLKCLMLDLSYASVSHFSSDGHEHYPERRIEGPKQVEGASSLVDDAVGPPLCVQGQDYRQRPRYENDPLERVSDRIWL